LPPFSSQIDPARVHTALEAVLQSPPFRTSKQCQALLRYIVEHTLAGEDHLLRERVIGANVFNRPPDYDTGNDPVVRARAGEVRKRLAQHYQQENAQAFDLQIDIPSGSYHATFDCLPGSEEISPPANAEPAPIPEVAGVSTEEQAIASAPPAPQVRPKVLRRFLSARFVNILLLAVSVILAAGWYHADTANRRFIVPWPINQFVGEKSQATVVLADVSYALRLLGDKSVPLDQYIDRSFVRQLLPQHMSAGEARVFDYLSVSRITSIADAHAAAALSQLTGPYAQNLFFRSARDLSPPDLTHGNLIFIGAISSNPWVQLYEDSLNFHVVESTSAEPYGIVNREPLAGEQSRYSTSAMTGTSGEDYATIALLPNRNGSGKVLIIQGLRMEGTEAAIYLLRNEELRNKLQSKLIAANRGTLPAYFEVLLHAQSVAGAPVTVDCVSIRIRDHQFQ
jgi:hypothetical protein